MKKKLTKKDYFEIIIFVTTFVIVNAIFSDWEGFKEGLLTAFN